MKREGGVKTIFCWRRRVDGSYNLLPSGGERSREVNVRTRLVAGLLVTVAVCIGAAPPLYAQTSKFSVGTATGTELSNCAADPGGAPGNCWGLNISCPNVKAIQPYDATVKVTTPTGQSAGTVVLMTGGGGIEYYDSYFTYGTTIINSVVAAGFTTAQIVFDNPVNGWLTGPAEDHNGPISLACLPATAMQWVYNAVLTSGTPLCATGNSGGAGAIAYGLSQYGLDSILTLAEPTSGPEEARLDYGCSPGGQVSGCAVCGTGTQDEAYGVVNDEDIIDPAYTGVEDGQPNGPCSEDAEGSTRNAAQLHHDSILSDIYPPQLFFATQIRALFGGLDTVGGAIPQALDWISFVTSSVTVVCLPGVGHAMPDYTAGATQIENDLISYCKLP